MLKLKTVSEIKIERICAGENDSELRYVIWS